MARGRTLNLVILVCCVFLCACNFEKTNKSSAFQLKDSDTIHYGSLFEPISFNPLKGLDSASYAGQYLIHDTLVGFDGSGKVVPRLAKAFGISEDGLLLWFELRPNLYFSDGSKVNTQDVVESIRRAGSKASPFKADYAAISSIDYKDKRIEIKLKNANSPLLSRLAEVKILPIISSSAHDQKSDNPLTIIGCGPFVLKKWDNGSKLVFERNEYYFGKKPDFKYFIWHIIPDKSVLLQALKTAQIDFASIDAALANADILQAANISKTCLTSNRTVYLGFNCETEPLNKPEIRHALSLAVNREKIARNYYHGFAIVPSGDVSPASFVFNQQLKPLPYDPKAAKNILNTEKFDFRRKFTIISVAEYEPLALLIADDLTELGLNVEVSVVEYTSLKQNYLRPKAFQMFILSRSSGPDPECGLVWQSGAYLNYCGFSNIELDQCLEKARQVYAPEKRSVYYHQVQKILAEQCPWIFIIQPKLVLVHQVYLKEIAGEENKRYGFPWDNPLFTICDWKISR